MGGRCILFKNKKQPETSFKDGNWQWICYNKPHGSPCKNPWEEVKQSNRKGGRCKGGGMSDTQNVHHNTCRANCAANPKCQSYSWTHTEGDRCILISSIQTEAGPDGSHKWVCFNKPSKPWTEIKQKNGKSGRCGGGGYTDNRNIHHMTCKSSCRANSKCKSYSWSP